MSQELDPSELATQEYWDTFYKREINNFHSNGDVGEIWFGEDIQERIAEWVNNKISKDSKILDVGCGNGMLLIQLSRMEFTDLHGVDYSKDAIVLAKDVAARYETNIDYSVGDILIGLGSEAFDVVLDKGTYDAISMSVSARESRKTYINNVYSALKSNGLLVLTSCNWTKEELINHFCTKFDVFNVILTPQFKFGGTIGSMFSSVIFKKKNSF